MQKLDLTAIRAEFPVLHQEVHGKPLVYLDNAATTQKPLAVLQALDQYYKRDNANIHRGAHALADRATGYFEQTRKRVAQFIGAAEDREIIFTKGTTESINLVAASFGERFVERGDEIVITAMEHHANIVPWQLLCQRKGAVLRVIPVLSDGTLDRAAAEALIGPKTKLLAFVHASNALGTINPAEELIALARKQGAYVLVDGAQSASHLQIDVQALDCDFFVFSAHKLYGPTGLGFLYGKAALLEEMPPYQGGGEMIREVSFEQTTFNDIPFKFEAGTPNIADVIAFGEALNFIEQHGKAAIKAHEDALLQQVVAELADVKGILPLGTAAQKVSVFSFNIQHMHPFDVGQMLDAGGIAVRTGHHCTQPLMAHYGLEGTVRASFAVYNTEEEVERFTAAVRRIAKLKNK